MAKEHYLAVAVLALLTACSLPAGGPAAIVQLKFLPQELVQQRLEMVVSELAARRDTLQYLFEQVGCRGERLTSQKVPGSKFPNLICTLPGTDPGAGMILASAHFDYIGGGIGAVDDWSGAALLPSLYQSLAVMPRRHTFVFAGFAAEHRGLTVPQIWALPADKRLLDAYNSVARSMEFDVRVANYAPGMDDDTHPFLNARIPVLTVHSLTSETVGFHHSPKDQLNAIDQKNYFQAYRLVATVLAFLDSQPK